MSILPHWVTFKKELQSVCVYKEIGIENIDRASIDICGLGYYELYINGKKVSEDLLMPACTDYKERDFSSLLYPSNDTTSHRIYFNRYDIKDYLKKGTNTVCVMVGNGFFRQQERYAEGDNCYSKELILGFDISLDKNENTEHIYSDESCVYSENFIKFNNVYFGEKHDYAVFDMNMVAMIPEKTEPCIKTERPESPIILQECPPDKVIKRIPAEKVFDDGNRKVYKLNETISGHAVLRSNGGNIKLTYSDYMNEDGSFVYEYTGGNGQIAFDEYYNTKPGQILYPHFTWHAFTYFDIDGNCEVLGADVVHSDCKQTVKFNCSNENLNWLFDAYIRTQLDNFHGGVPSDCPHRERLGYTGDGQLTAETAMLLLDTEKFYEKWIRDIMDCQDIKSGHIQHTAPFYGGGGGPGGWGCAMVVVPYKHYKRFGKKEILEEAYPNMTRWIDSMVSFSDNGLIVREYEGGWCLGDWCTLEKVTIPEPLVNTYYFIKSLGYLIEICNVLEKDASRFEELKTISEKAFKNEYFNEDNGTFANSIQGADVFGYDLGLGDERTFKKIVDIYSEKGHFDTGIFGTEILCTVLADTGNYELLYKLLNSEDLGSFAFMRKNGATTLWENWNGRESRNHPMFGGPAKHLIYGFAGMRYENGKFVFEPHIINGLEFAYTEEESERGKAKIFWKKDNGTITIEAESDKEAILKFGNEETVFTGKVNKTYNI